MTSTSARDSTVGLFRWTTTYRPVAPTVNRVGTPARVVS